MSLIGKDLSQLDTPTLWVDLDKMEANIRLIAEYLRTCGVAWRPHIKGIKIPALAQQLLAAGATGVTCAKLGEAEVMAAGGIHDILVANQVVGETKINRLCSLQHKADVMVAVTELDNAQQISHIASQVGVQVPVLIELNVGMERAGVEPGEKTIGLACQVSQLPGLRFMGLMAWEGHVVGMTDPAAKQAETERAVHSLVDTACQVRAEGIEVPIVSCGGSGSYRITARIPGVTEIQAGGAALGDVTYEHWGAGITPALHIQVLVTSRPTPTRAIIDAGRKTMNCEVFMPEVQDLPGVKIVSLSAEHGVLSLDDPQIPLKTGDVLNVVVGYGDWTVFLHDRLYGVRSGKVEATWEIEGRGKLT